MALPGVKQVDSTVDLRTISAFDRRVILSRLQRWRASGSLRHDVVVAFRCSFDSSGDPTHWGVGHLVGRVDSLDDGAVRMDWVSARPLGFSFDRPKEAVMVWRRPLTNADVRHFLDSEGHIWGAPFLGDDISLEALGPIDVHRSAWRMMIDEEPFELDVE